MIGQNEPTREAKEATERMRRESGAMMTFVKADVMDARGLFAVVETGRRGWLHIDGVLHAASVSLLSSMSRQDMDTFGWTFGSKVRGIWNLHEMKMKMKVEKMADTREGIRTV